MRPPRPYSIPAELAPRPVSFGPMPPTTRCDIGARGRRLNRCQQRAHHFLKKGFFRPRTMPRVFEENGRLFVKIGSIVEA
jgi:hypothetical protein